METQGAFNAYKQTLLQNLKLAHKEAYFLAVLLNKVKGQLICASNFEEWEEALNMLDTIKTFKFVGLKLERLEREEADGNEKR